MDDPTTIALNLTFFGTLGIAFLMFLGLGFLVILTLVLAGIGRLAALILLSMVGIFPRRDTVPIVKLPSLPGYSPHADADALSTVGFEGTEHPLEPPTADGIEPARPTISSRARAAVAGFVATTAARTAAAWATVASISWKSLLDPRRLPTPDKLKEGAKAGLETAIATQAKRHPLIVAAKEVPPVLSPKWAAAVEQADLRAAERAKAAELPQVRVTVRDLPSPDVPAEDIKEVAPLVESALR